MSQVFLKPHQPKLIKWFAQYRVSLTKKEQERKRPNFPVIRNDSQSFDPNAIDKPNLILTEDDATSSRSSSDDDQENIDGPPSQP